LNSTVNKEIIDRKENSKRKKKDILQALIAATDPDAHISTASMQVRDYIHGYLVRSQGATGAALAWAVYLLTQHRPTEKKMMEEIDRVCGDKPPTSASLKQLTYTRQIIMETFRLYPPVPLFTRGCGQSVSLDDKSFPADTLFVIPVYGVHHSEKYWDDPERFDVDRHKDSEDTKFGWTKTNFSYLPFGGGPESAFCFHLAVTQLVVALVLLHQNFSFSFEEQRPPEIRGAGSIRPKDGILVQIHTRNKRPAKAAQPSVESF